MDQVKPHILWLDYDGPIDKDQVFDIETASSRMAPGSILIATFDVDFDKGDERIRDLPPEDRSAAWHARFQAECGDFFNPAWNVTDFAASTLHRRVADVASAAIVSGEDMREGISFHPIFNFVYADGHEMLTLGGMICSRDEKENEVGGLGPFALHSQYLFLGFRSRLKFRSSLRRERLHLDSHMPCEDGWTPDFGLEPEEIRLYRDIYRYCPLYAELML